MRAALLDEIHPGEILLDEFLKPRGIPTWEFTADAGVAPGHVSRLVRGRQPICLRTADCLGRYFGREPRYWVNFQVEYDMRIARDRLRSERQDEADKVLRTKLADALAQGESVASRGDIARERHAEGKPVYIGDPAEPGTLIRIGADGIRCRGRMINRLFVPDDA